MGSKLWKRFFFFSPLPVFVDKIGKYSMFVVIFQKLISSSTHSHHCSHGRGICGRRWTAVLSLSGVPTALAVPQEGD